MKKILSLLCAVLVVVSCAKEENYQFASGEGAMKFALAAGSTVTADDTITIKIYKENEESGEYELVRRFTHIDDVPSTLALLEGQYKVAVQVGQRNVVSFEERCYYGEKFFTVTAGQIEAVAVDCKLQSTIVNVVYGNNIATKFVEGFATTVAIAEEYNQTDIDSNDVHSLKYTESKEGYFIMPEEESTLVWQFEGYLVSETDAEELGNGGKITRGGKIEDVKANTRYTIKLNYSADAPGGLIIEAIVEEEPDAPTNSPIVNFSPDPTLVCVGHDIAEQFSAVEEYTFNIGALASIDTIEISLGGVTYDLLADEQVAGVDVVWTGNEDNISYSMVISPEFLLAAAAGNQIVSLYVEDSNGGKKTFDLNYLCQGVYAISTEDYDLWKGAATFKACVLNTEATDVKVAYRVQGTEAWQMATATAGSNNIYTAVAANFAAEKTYEYKLVIGGVDTGKSLSVTTATGKQLPNANFEEWADSKTPGGLWSSGNNSFTTLMQRDDNGHSGSCAYLKSKSAMGVFAAGNLFTGAFEMNISTMSGKVTFGKDFAFNAKPASVTFWMKNTVGTINNGDKASGLDPYSAMVLITDGTTYTVDTTDESTFLPFDSLASKPGIIAYGYVTGQESNGDWVEKTMTLTYVDGYENMTPKKISVSFSPSAYGDYFCGSTDSEMYIDDVRINY